MLITYEDGWFVAMHEGRQRCVEKSLAEVEAWCRQRGFDYSLTDSARQAAQSVELIFCDRRGYVIAVDHARNGDVLFEGPLEDFCRWALVEKYGDNVRFTPGHLLSPARWGDLHEKGCTYRPPGYKHRAHSGDLEYVG